MWSPNIHKRFNYVNIKKNHLIYWTAYLMQSIFCYLQILLSVNLSTDKTLFVSSKSILTILSSFVDMYRVTKI